MLCLTLWACSSGGTTGYAPKAAIIVNSLEDLDSPPTGTMTLRAAVARVPSGGTITFDPALDGGTIKLSIVGSSDSVLKGEVYAPQYLGYQERNYGKSALYARKDFTVDASGLPQGITITWTGGDSNRARVLAIYGNLTMRNVSITSGYASAVATSGSSQPYTLARGGGLAVWGTATLHECMVSGNRVSGDLGASRDRGAYGGGIYANGLNLSNCVVSGNSATGYGAAGGGVFSVGGADNTTGVGHDVTLSGCTVSGNRVTAQHAYGGGIFTLAGGPDNLASMHLTNCTIARNLAEDHPDLAEAGQYYYRGGGVYLGGGSLLVTSCTIAENEVRGNPALFSGKPNMGGGGIAATIGNAHVIENMEITHSLIAGNSIRDLSTGNETASDISTGSLLHFYSFGYNLVGTLDFSQILVPVSPYWSLSRKHWPKSGDRDGVAISTVLALNSITYHGSIRSAGTDAGGNAVLWYPPSGSAVDQIPGAEYTVNHVVAQYEILPGKTTDDFLNLVLTQLRTVYGGTLGSSFGGSIEPVPGAITWHGPVREWPSNPDNAAWITFWRDLDALIGDRLGTVKLGDDFWGTFSSGTLGGNLRINVVINETPVRLTKLDQRNKIRPSGLNGDIGAIEK